MRRSPRFLLQSTSPSLALMMLSPQENFIVPYCAIALHQHAFRDQRKWRLLYPVAAFFCMSALTLQYILPDKESFAYQQFQENYKDSPARWTAILLATGFSGALSKTDFYLKNMARAIEYYMEFNHHMLFAENRDPETKKERVFFRGEKRKDADALFFGERHRTPLLWNLQDGSVCAPYVKDALEHGVSLPNGYTKALISVTSCEKVTTNYGDAEAVLVVVPRHHRVACVGQHGFRGSENYQCEYVVAGIHKNEVFLIAYRDPDTHEICEVKVNPQFSGKIENLELDQQMLPFIRLIEDPDMRTRLYQQVDHGLDYLDHYRDQLSPTKESFLEAAVKRFEVVGSHGYRGSQAMRLMHRLFHGSPDALRQAYIERMQLCGDLSDHRVGKL